MKIFPYPLFLHLRFLEELALLKINELLTLLKLTLCTRLMLNCSQNCIYFQMNCLFLFWKIVGENMDGIHNQKYLNSWFLFGQSWPTDTTMRKYIALLTMLPVSYKTNESVYKSQKHRKIMNRWPSNFFLRNHPIISI